MSISRIKAFKYAFFSGLGGKLSKFTKTSQKFTFVITTIGCLKMFEAVTTFLKKY
jgi:hypothetical protein